YPIITTAGFDPVWFGVIMTINMEIGLIHPPVGLNIYIVNSIAPDVPVTRVMWGTIPYVICMMLAIVILCIFPDIATWLPDSLDGPASQTTPPVPHRRHIFRRRFADPRRGALRRHGSTADDDRRAYARDRTGLGRRARRIDPHAAMDDLRVGENLVEGIDRPGWNPYRLELGQQVGAGPAHGQRGQPSDQLLAVLEPIGIRAIARLLGDFGFT